MWFGDLVTMRWWDDLWLNESFAEYMAHRGARRRHRVHRRVGRLRRSRARPGATSPTQRPSTHPVAGDAGARRRGRAAELRRHLLRQGRGGAAPAGRLPRRRRVPRRRRATTSTGTLRQRRRWPTSSLRWSGRAARTCTAWSDAWLRTARLDTVSLDVETDGGVVTAARLHRVAPAGEAVQRPHSLDVAGFTDGAEVFRVERRRRAATSPTLPALVGRPAARLVVPNAGDLTWATVRLDEATLQALPAQLASVPDTPGPRRAVDLPHRRGLPGYRGPPADAAHLRGGVAGRVQRLGRQPDLAASWSAG